MTLFFGGEREGGRREGRRVGGISKRSVVMSNVLPQTAQI